MKTGERKPPPPFLRFGGLVLLFMLVIAINGVFLRSAGRELLDFGSFMASGIAAAKGQNPYAADSPLILRVIFPWLQEPIPSPNLNPPITVLLFQRISTADPFHALTTWRLLSVIGYAASLLLLWKTYHESRTWTRTAWAFCLAGLWHTIHLGQIYIPLLLLIIAAWVFSQNGQPKLAGLALGLLISVKPNFIYWAVLLGVSGSWSAFLVAGMTAAAVSLIPLAVYGHPIYLQWMEAVRGYPQAGLLIPGNSSLQSLTLHLGSILPGLLLSLLLATWGIRYAYRRRGTMEAVNTLGIVNSLLISPLAWTGYTLFTLPIFMAKKRWSTTDKVAAAIFIVPYWVVLALSMISQITFPLFGWLYGWGLLALLAGTMTSRDKKPAALPVDSKDKPGPNYDDRHEP